MYFAGVSRPREPTLKIDAPGFDHSQARAQPAGPAGRGAGMYFAGVSSPREPTLKIDSPGFDHSQARAQPAKWGS
ncbi:hypothetical protein H4V99_002410 [Cryobacterium sp. CG_9.6]|nr:hypothetical protein [Cryobacterium sp. CG_9.6]